jgi:hypothetical protein
MNTTTQRRVAAVLAVVGLITVAAGGAFAAAPTVDTETTDTATTSEITDGTVIQNFTANDSEASIIQADYDSDNPKVKVLDENNDTVTSYTASDMTETNTSQDYYNTTINHSVLNNVEISPGEQVNVTLRLINNTEVDSPDTTNVTLTLDGADGRTVRVVDSSLSSDAFTADAAGFDIPVVGTVSVPVFGTSGDTSTYSPDSSIPINGSNSTVEIHYANTSGASSLSTVADELSSEAWAKGIAVQTDEGPVKTYVDAAPSDVNESNTYAVYDTGDDDLVIHTGDEYEGESSLTGLSVNGNAGFLDRIGVYGIEVGGMTVDASSIPGLGLMGFGTGNLAVAGLLFARPRRQQSS